MPAYVSERDLRPRLLPQLPPDRNSGYPPFDPGLDPGADPIAGSPDYFNFDGSVGRNAANQRQDVIKAQTLLGNAGYYDLAGTDGPTGWYGKPLELAMRRYQKDNGLTVDGIMQPGGETLSALQASLGPRLQAFDAPTADEVDWHHDRIAQGQQGLLSVTPLGATPAGVKTEHGGDAPGDRSQEKQVAQVDEAAAAAALLGLTVYAAGGAIARKIAQDRQVPKPQPDTATDGQIGSGASADPQVQAFHAQNRAMLDKGVVDAWGGAARRNENDNTRLSSNIVVQQCLKVIAVDTELAKAGFEHIAGASEKGAGEKEKKEMSIRNSRLRRGGKGRSLPDILFRDKAGNLVGINTATESSPGRYVKWERGSFDRLLYNMGHHVAKIIGKKRQDETEDEYGARAEQVCRDAFDEAKIRIGRAQEAKDGADGAAPDAAPANGNPE